MLHEAFCLFESVTNFCLLIKLLKLIVGHCVTGVGCFFQKYYPNLQGSTIQSCKERYPKVISSRKKIQSYLTLHTTLSSENYSTLLYRRNTIELLSLNHTL